MFLSKNPVAYYGYDWPSNTMQGLTITGENFGLNFTDIVLQKRYPRPFLSIEPLLGNIPDADYSRFEKVIVGAMTGPKAVKPELEWVKSIKKNVPADKIYWKNNIKKYL